MADCSGKHKSSEFKAPKRSSEHYYVELPKEFRIFSIFWNKLFSILNAITQQIPNIAFPGLGQIGEAFKPD
jgi:hypothetical protein